MDLKHSPEAAIHQTLEAECLERWYSGPQGQRVLDALHRQLKTFCKPRFGDFWVEVGPLSLLRPEWAGPAHVVHAGPRSRTLRALAGSLPLAPESVSCVLLAHALGERKDDESAIAEAVRVMASEGHLFLLEAGHCTSTRGRVVSRALPLGLRRRRFRRLLADAGLGVRGQFALSILPADLPRGWHRRLGAFDATVSPWLPLISNCVLTVARRRDLIPLTPVAARPRWSRGAVRAGGTSQWA